LALGRGFGAQILTWSTELSINTKLAEPDTNGKATAQQHKLMREAVVDYFRKMEMIG
jgi:hypothetical protein